MSTRRPVNRWFLGVFLGAWVLATAVIAIDWANQSRDSSFPGALPSMSIGGLCLAILITMMAALVDQLAPYWTRPDTQTRPDFMTTKRRWIRARYLTLAWDFVNVFTVLVVAQILFLVLSFGWLLGFGDPRVMLLKLLVSNVVLCIAILSSRLGRIISDAKRDDVMPPTN